MKKKEILITFVLALLATGGSSFYPVFSEVSFYNFLFWFLVLATGWWVVRNSKSSP